MIYNMIPAQIAGLTTEEMYYLGKLLAVFNSHSGSNAVKQMYYEGNISLSSVNLGIALPEGISGLEIGCAWGAKTVDVLASRSMFDGFVGTSGESADMVDRIVEGNALIAGYNKAVKDELLYGCSFATLSADPEVGCRIRFHSAQTASALWDGEAGRIRCGFAIIDAAEENNSSTWVPTVVNYYTADSVIVLRRVDNIWTAERHRHKMGRPLMEPLIYNATNSKPFGRSRLKKPIRRLIDSYVRTLANAAIGLEFATAPQKYLLGVSDEQFDAVVSNKFKQYVGNILTSTVNPETGEKPTFGQLQQGHIAPHIEMLRALATQFSAATGLTVTDTGVVNDANPTSSDAILAQSQTLVLMAEQLNQGNTAALKTIIQMAQAIALNEPLNALTDEQRDVIPHFKNPAMPSVASTSDAAIKIASARQSFAQTDTFLEMIGFDQADIRRIKAQESRARGTAVLTEEFNDEGVS